MEGCRLGRFAVQVEKELAEERVAAEAEAKRAQAAIQAKQQELHQIEQQRQREVPCYLLHPTLTALLAPTIISVKGHSVLLLCLDTA